MLYIKWSKFRKKQKENVILKYIYLYKSHFCSYVTLNYKTRGIPCIIDKIRHQLLARDYGQF